VILIPFMDVIPSTREGITEPTLARRKRRRRGRRRRARRMSADEDEMPEARAVIPYAFFPPSTCSFFLSRVFCYLRRFTAFCIAG
jgi:hypothetical protein